MSWLPSNDPILGDPRSCDALELVIVPRTRDLGDGFEVRRALPHGKRQMVGPFIFFDHFGPVQFIDRKSTRLNSSHEWISYAVFCLKKNNQQVLVIAVRGHAAALSISPAVAGARATRRARAPAREVQEAPSTYLTPLFFFKLCGDPPIPPLFPTAPPSG